MSENVQIETYWNTINTHPKMAAYKRADTIIRNTPNAFSENVILAILPNPTVDMQLIVKYSADM